MADKFEEIVEEMKVYIERDVAAGFSDVDEIVEMGVDMVADQADAESLRPEAERLTAEAVERRLKEQESWSAVTDCDRLDAAFAELEENGIVSRQNFSCCGTCGQSEMWDEIDTVQGIGKPVRGYTFYHMQDTESAVEGYGLCFNYGANEEGEDAALKVANDIVTALRDHGLKPEWNGSWDKRIQLPIEWKRRR
ncbi:MAG TPA: hypothetical protein VK612_07695 [Pyrinomonadaceae bacterium]|nr:hypothetical protein [Pyrinomonadaceae bacterium]